MSPFTEVHPSLENYWRAVILFGRNVASYKFALAKTLLELAGQGKALVPLTELAVPFARHVCEHLKASDKQATSPRAGSSTPAASSTRARSAEERLVDTTVRLGFNNVIDAFHVVDTGEVGVRFFADERGTPRKGIRLTDDLFRLAESYQCREPARTRSRPAGGWWRRPGSSTCPGTSWPSATTPTARCWWSTTGGSDGGPSPAAGTP